MREAVAQDPARFLEIPIPAHEQRHRWLLAFLAEIGRRDEYFGSIGGWMKEHASPEDVNDWREFEWEQIEEYACEMARGHGVTLDLF